MNTALRKQRGMSLGLILIVVGFFAILGLFALKVGPGYFEYRTVQKIAEDTAANPTVMAMPHSKVLNHIDKSYRNNNLWDLRADDTIVLKKAGRSGYTVEVDYEKRSPLFANIAIVSVYKKTVTTP